MTLWGLLENKRVFCSTWLSFVIFTFANGLRPLWTQTGDVKDRVEEKARVIHLVSVCWLTAQCWGAMMGAQKGNDIAPGVSESGGEKRHR